MTHILGKRKFKRICRGCGCTDNNACVTEHGPCFWILQEVETPTGICSACAVELDFDQPTMAIICRPEVRDLLQQMGVAA